MVERVTALLWGLGGYVFSVGWELLPILVFTCGLTALAFIDLEHFILPGHIVGPLLLYGASGQYECSGCANTEFSGMGRSGWLSCALDDSFRPSGHYPEAGWPGAG